MWEHMVIDTESSKKTIQQELDEASSNGWELVSVCCDGDYDWFYLFFKRPKR